MMAQPALACSAQYGYHRPVHDHPTRSTLGIGLSFLLTQGETLDQPVSRIFHEVFAILRAEDRGNDARRLVRLRRSSKSGRSVGRTITQMEAFGMRYLMRQTGQRGQTGIRVDPFPRQRSAPRNTVCCARQNGSATHIVRL